MGFLGAPLGIIMKFIYDFIQNYGWSLIIFTVIVRLAMFPLSAKQQKSTAKMGLITPKQQALQKKHGKNKQKYQEELMKLYEEEGYNPMSSCLPSLIPMVILFGIIDVVYNPLKHILALPTDIIDKAVEIVGTAGGSSPQLYIVNQIQNGSTEFNSVFSNEVLDSIMNFDLNFLGLNLGLVPNFSLPLILIPILSGITSLGYTLLMLKKQKDNPMQAQGAGVIKGMMYIMPVFSVVIAFQVPVGVGLYWIISNITTFIQTLVLNKIYTPERIKAMAEKDNANRKKKKPSRFQEAMKQAREEQMKKQGVSPEGKVISESSSAEDLEENVETNPTKITANQKIALARKKMAEKYGDDTEN